MSHTKGVFLKIFDILNNVYLKARQPPRGNVFKTKYYQKKAQDVIL